MGLSYTGKSCLEVPSVMGYRRVPEPPARIIPFIDLLLTAPAGSCHPARAGTIPGYPDTTARFSGCRFRRFLVAPSRVLAGFYLRLWRSACRGRGGPLRA